MLRTQRYIVPMSEVTIEPAPASRCVAVAKVATRPAAVLLDSASVRGAARTHVAPELIAGSAPPVLPGLLLDHALNKVPLGTIDTYVGLYTTPPQPDGYNWEEVEAPSYSRQRVYENGSASTPRWKLAASEAGGGFLVENLHDVAFPQAAEAWGLIKGFAIYTAPTGNVVLTHGPLGNLRRRFVADAGTDRFYAPGHGFSNDQKVLFRRGPNDLPTGVVRDTEYFVVGATGDDFQVSLTPGGSAINLTSDGEGYAWLSQWQNVQSGQQITLIADALELTFR